MENIKKKIAQLRVELDESKEKEEEAKRESHAKDNQIQEVHINSSIIEEVNNYIV